MSETSETPARAWADRLNWALRLTSVALILCGLGYLGSDHFAGGEEHYIQLSSAPRQLVIGQPHVLSLVVRRVGDTTPIAGATVAVTMTQGGQTAEIGRFTTDDRGVAVARFVTPELPPGKAVLQIGTESSVGTDTVKRPVLLAATGTRELLVSADKPLYQPGQRIRVRTLSRMIPTMRPRAGVATTFELVDPKRNKVFRETRQTSDYGIAATEIELADEVILGTYTLRVTQPATGGWPKKTVEQAVVVKRYALPPFRVTMRTQGGSAVARPGSEVTLDVDAQYLFGKPVAGGAVSVAATNGRAIHRELRTPLTATLDARGRASVTLRVPKFALGERTLKLPLVATVTDRAGHAERGGLTLSLANRGIAIEVVAAGGLLLPTSKPQPMIISTVSVDGTPVSCDVEVTAGGEVVAAGRTDVLGLLKLEMPARNCEISATAESGLDGLLRYRANPGDPAKGVDIRADRALYRVGETVGLTLACQRPEPVRVDVLRDGEVSETLHVQLDDANAGKASLTLRPDHAGILAIRATQQTARGAASLGELRVFVSRDGQLRIAERLIPLDRDGRRDDGTYVPGARVRYELTLTDTEGAPVVGAISASIIDRSVLALAQAAPGMASPAAAFERAMVAPRAAPSQHPASGFNRSGDWKPRRHYYGRGRRVVYDDRIGSSAFDVAEMERTAPQARTQRAMSPAVLARDDLSDAQRQAAASFLIARYAAPHGMPLVEDNRRGKLTRQTRAKREWSEWFGNNLMLLFGLMVLLLFVRFVPLGPSQGAAGLVLVVTGLTFYASLSMRDEFRGEGIVFFILLATAVALGTLYQILKSIETSPAFLQSFRLNSLALCGVALGFVGGALMNGPGGGALLAGGMGAVLGLIAAYAMARGQGVESDEALGDMAPIPLLILLGGLVVVFFGNDIKELFYASSSSLRAGKQMKVQYDARQAGVGFESARESHDTANLDNGAPGTGGGAPLKTARTRKRFVETLLWEPQLITGPDGKASLEMTLADNITSWRTLLEAVDAQGRLGYREASFTTFLPFFVRPDVPRELTQNDEVEIPVALHNYARQAQTIRLELAKGSWFEVLGPATISVPMKAGEVTSRTFRVRATRFGSERLRIVARSTSHADAVERDVVVVPDGERIEGSVSGTLKSLSETLEIPEDIIPGSARAWLRVHPGVASDVMQGLDGLLRMPYG